MSAPKSSTPLEALASALTANMSVVERDAKSDPKNSTVLQTLHRDELLAYVQHGAFELRCAMAALLAGLNEMERRGWKMETQRPTGADQ